MIENKDIKQLLEQHHKIEKDITARIDEFKMLWDTCNSEICFRELVFCIFTPQSKATVCWQAVKNLEEKNFILHGSAEEIANSINGVRFHNVKAKNVIEARNKLTVKGKIILKDRILELSKPLLIREWLVNEIKGIGYKEASHYLRNIGMGEELAILDRHILKNLHRFNLIDKIPTSLSIKQYLELEKIMSNFAKKVKIPLDHLDFLFWYSQTGMIFK